MDSRVIACEYAAAPAVKQEVTIKAQVATQATVHAALPATATPAAEQATAVTAHAAKQAATHATLLNNSS